MSRVIGISKVTLQPEIFSGWEKLSIGSHDSISTPRTCDHGRLCRLKALDSEKEAGQISVGSNWYFTEQTLDNTSI